VQAIAADGWPPLRAESWIIEVAKRSELHAFAVLTKRWIVERTIAWLNRCRRLAKDWKNLNRKALAAWLLRAAHSISLSVAVTARGRITFLSLRRDRAEVGKT